MIMTNYIVSIKNSMNLHMKFSEVQNVMSINNVQTRYISKKVMEKVSFSSPKVELCRKPKLHVSYVYGVHSYCIYLIIYCSKM